MPQFVTANLSNIKPKGSTHLLYTIIILLIILWCVRLANVPNFWSIKWSECDINIIIISRTGISPGGHWL